MEQRQELVHGVPHLRLGEVEQGDDLEVQLPQQVGEVVHVHHGSFEPRVVLVGQVADQQRHFVRSCEGTRRRTQLCFYTTGGDTLQETTVLL